jgi:hypothetical protein
VNAYVPAGLCYSCHFTDGYLFIEDAGRALGDNCIKGVCFEREIVSIGLLELNVYSSVHRLQPRSFDHGIGSIYASDHAIETLCQEAGTFSRSRCYVQKTGSWIYATELRELSRYLQTTWMENLQPPILRLPERLQ